MKPAVALAKPYLAARHGRVREQLARLKLDGLLISHTPDLAYLTDFTGDDSMGLATAGRFHLITDFRYQEQAQIESPWVRMHLRDNKMSDALAKAIKSAGTGRLGYEADHLSVAQLRALRKAIREQALRVDLVATDGVLGDLRKIKDAHEIQLVRQAITVAQDAFVAVRRQIRPGMTENHLAGLMMLELRARGASDASFPPIIASGAPSSLPHYRPTDAAIKPNRPLLIDWGAFLGGYCSDLTRTLLLGRVAARIRTIYSIVLEAQAAAIAFLRPGVTSRQADSVARRIIAKAGFGKQFGHGLGHGIGREIHEGPALRRKGEAQELLPGMIVTVEPGIYLPGEGGVRIEDDVLITDRGCEVLSSLPKTFDECRIG